MHLLVGCPAILQSLQKGEDGFVEVLPPAGHDEMQLRREHVDVLIKFTWWLLAYRGVSGLHLSQQLYSFLSKPIKC